MLPKSYAIGWFFSLLFVGLIACERPLKLEWETTEDIPVLLGVLEPGQPLALQLFRSTNPLDTNDFPTINDANVRVQQAGEETLLPSVGEGGYLTPAGWEAQAGERYRAEVMTAQGEQIVSQWVTVPTEPTLQTWRYEPDSYQSASSSEVRDLLTLVFAPHDRGIAYYELQVVGLKASGEGEPVVISRVESGEALDAACGLGNQVFTDRCYPDQPLRLAWALTPEYTVDTGQSFDRIPYDSLLVVVSSLSEGLYRYKTSLLTDELTSVFLYTDTVYTNIQGGQGLLGAQATRTLGIGL
jgi:hypothetical protein